MDIYTAKLDIFLLNSPHLTSIKLNIKLIPYTKLNAKIGTAYIVNLRPAWIDKNEINIRGKVNKKLLYFNTKYTYPNIDIIKYIKFPETLFTNILKLIDWASATYFKALLKTNLFLSKPCI